MQVTAPIVRGTTFSCVTTWVRTDTWMKSSQRDDSGDVQQVYGKCSCTERFPAGDLIFCPSHFYGSFLKWLANWLMRSACNLRQIFTKCNFPVNSGSHNCILNSTCSQKGLLNFSVRSNFSAIFSGRVHPVTRNYGIFPVLQRNLAFLWKFCTENCRFSIWLLIFCIGSSTEWKKSIPIWNSVQFTSPDVNSSVQQGDSLLQSGARLRVSSGTSSHY